MLALTRKVDEGIIINGNIEIKILGIQDGKVRIGIEAPRDIAIYRKEVYLDTEISNKEAMGKDVDVLMKLKEMMGER